MGINKKSDKIEITRRNKKIERKSEVCLTKDDYEPSIARRALENDRDLLLNDLPFCCIEMGSAMQMQ